jgi:hypothetical protein
MSLEREVFLNRLAQGLVPEEEGRLWFLELAVGEQCATLQTLWFLAAQAGARQDDVGDAIIRAKLKASLTPCVLLKSGDLKIQAAKVLGLPQSEYEKCFRLLLALFEIADERRRSTECRNGCSHWWHAPIQRS